jgi:hypothetical protein
LPDDQIELKINPMANLTINQSLVNKLADHFRKGGEDDDKVLTSLLGLRRNIPEYLAGYRQAILDKFPSEFGQEDEGLGSDDEALGEDEPVAEAPPAPRKQVEPPNPTGAAAKKFIFRQDNGVDLELEVVKETSKAIVLGVPKVKIPVTIILRGNPLEVDLAELRALPGNAERHGVPVARLIVLAEAAQA